MTARRYGPLARPEYNSCAPTSCRKCGDVVAPMDTFCPEHREMFRRIGIAEGVDAAEQWANERVRSLVHVLESDRDTEQVPLTDDGYGGSEDADLEARNYGATDVPQSREDPSSSGSDVRGCSSDETACIQGLRARALALASDIECMVHAFSDEGRREGVRQLARAVRALGDTDERPHRFANLAHDVHAALVRRPLNASLEGAHELAIAAKEVVFRAQDAVSRAWELEADVPTLRKVEKRLAKVRTELEALDRDVLAARSKAGRR